MTRAHTPAEMSKGQSDNTNNATKSWITQRLRTDLGRSVGGSTVTQLVWFTGFTGPTLGKMLHITIDPSGQQRRLCLHQMNTGSASLALLIIDKQSLCDTSPSGVRLSVCLSVHKQLLVIASPTRPYNVES